MEHPETGEPLWLIRDVAEILGKSERTLRRWEAKEGFPKALRWSEVYGKLKRPSHNIRLYTRKNVEEIKRYFGAQGLRRYQVAEEMAKCYHINVGSAAKWLERNDSKIKPRRINGKVRYFEEQLKRIKELRE